MNPLSAGYATATGDHFVLLDHDINGWTVALIVAVIAAFIYEMFMALTKAVTRRIPFLILRIARRSTPEGVRTALYEKWTADLWDILNEKGFFVAKFVRGMLFATQLALYGARSTAAVVSPKKARQKISDMSPNQQFMIMIATAMAGLVIGGILATISIGLGLGTLVAWVFWLGGAAGGLLTSLLLHFRTGRVGKPE